MKTKGQENEELKNLAPTLFSMRQENPFAVPDGYFSSLNEQVVQQIQSLPDFETVAKDNPFSVPDGYFNSLTVAIQRRISGEQRRQADWKEKLSEIRYRIFGQVRLVPSLAFATVALLLIFGVKYMTRTIAVEDTPAYLTANELSTSGYLSEIDENMIIEQLGNKATVPMPAIDKSMEDYLINNDVDINSIADQL